MEKKGKPCAKKKSVPKIYGSKTKPKHYGTKPKKYGSKPVKYEKEDDHSWEMYNAYDLSTWSSHKKTSC